MPKESQMLTGWCSFLNEKCQSVQQDVVEGDGQESVGIQGNGIVVATAFHLERGNVQCFGQGIADNDGKKGLQNRLVGQPASTV